MSPRRMRPELLAELLTELVAELPEEFVEWRAGLNWDLLLPIIALIAVVLQHRWFGRTGYFDPYGDHCGFNLGDDVGKADRTLHTRFSTVRWQRSRCRLPITRRSGEQYCGTKYANRCQQCQPAASKMPRFSATRVSLHYPLHQATSPADLATHKWRRLTYENMESALIRGNYFYESFVAKN